MRYILCNYRGLIFVLFLPMGGSWASIESKKIEEQLTVSIADGKNKIDVKLASVWWEPPRPKSEKTAIIIIPGYENTSYRALRTGDGKGIYERALEVGTLWQKAFAMRGYYVFAYDKRTCSPEFDSTCPRYLTDDIDRIGPEALSNDLDTAQQPRQNYVYTLKRWCGL